MSAHQPIASASDDISEFFPGITPENHALRARLRSARNVAQFVQQQTAPGGTADGLLAILEQHARDYLYAPVSPEMLAQGVELARQIYRAAQLAEKLEGFT